MVIYLQGKEVREMRRERVEFEILKELKRQEVEKIKAGSPQLEMMIWKFLVGKRRESCEF